MRKLLILASFRLYGKPFSQLNYYQKQYIKRIVDAKVKDAIVEYAGLYVNKIKELVIRGEI